MKAVEEPSGLYDLASIRADYPIRLDAPSQSLILCSYQRSGSTLLGEAIHDASGLGCPLEYFHTGFRPRFARRWNADNIRTYAEAVYRYRTDPSGILSVKLFWYDLEEIAAEIAPQSIEKKKRSAPKKNRARNLSRSLRNYPRASPQSHIRASDAARPHEAGRFLANRREDKCLANVLGGREG